jgi:hypothetical protein
MKTNVSILWAEACRFHRIALETTSMPKQVQEVAWLRAADAWKALAMHSEHTPIDQQIYLGLEKLARDKSKERS